MSELRYWIVVSFWTFVWVHTGEILDLWDYGPWWREAAIAAGVVGLMALLRAGLRRSASPPDLDADDLRLDED